uniref:Uncharacterized protein n=1 Tax=Angiostrongylus cantonensis TaxID=6313 RepID=A0A0K0CWD9_ANGCA
MITQTHNATTDDCGLSTRIIGPEEDDDVGTIAELSLYNSNPRQHMLPVERQDFKSIEDQQGELLHNKGHSEDVSNYRLICLPYVAYV